MGGLIVSMDMVYSKHAEEIGKYLASKLPDVPPHTAQEIAAYIGQKTHILVVDMLREYEREQRRAMKMPRRNSYPTCSTCAHNEYHMPQCKECNATNNFKYYTEI